MASDTATLTLEVSVEFPDRPFFTFEGQQGGGISIHLSRIEAVIYDGLDYLTLVTSNDTYRIKAKLEAVQCLLNNYYKKEA